MKMHKLNHTISDSEQDCTIFFCEIFLFCVVCRTTVAVAAAAIAIVVITMAITMELY